MDDRSDASRQREALEIAAKADFKELTVGYYHTTTPWPETKWNTTDQWETKPPRTEWIPMDEPVPCRYSTGYHHTEGTWANYGSPNYGGGSDEWISESEPPINWFVMDTPREWSRNTENESYAYVGKQIVREAEETSAHIPDGAERGITLRQLRAVKANADRRCLEEGWTDWQGDTLQPETVTMYDICRYVILPFTVQTKRSFVESLPSTAGTQPPIFFVSHWWGEPTKDFLACIERLIQDKWIRRNPPIGFTEDTPIWICAYANNQWDLREAVTMDPDDSAFSRAIALANGRTVTIFDKHGIVFERIWCIYELHKTILLPVSPTDQDGKADTSQNWVILTSFQHEQASVICEPDVFGANGKCHVKIPREAAKSGDDCFPFDLVMKALRVRVENAKASVESDRIHIFNAIIGNKQALDSEPPASHELYDRLNEEVGAKFGATCAILKSAATRSDHEWNAAMANGKKTTTMSFRFGSEEWTGLAGQPLRAAMLLRSLPLSLINLSIYIREVSFGPQLIEGLADWIGNSTKLQELSIEYFSGSESLETDLLAKALPGCRTLTKISASYSVLLRPQNVHHWADLLTNTNSLKHLIFWGTCAVDDDAVKTLALGVATNTSLSSIHLDLEGDKVEADHRMNIEVRGKDQGEQYFHNQRISIFASKLGKEAAQELCCALLKHKSLARNANNQIEELTIEDLSFSFPVVEALRQWIKNSETTENVVIKDSVAESGVAVEAGECLAHTLSFSSKLCDLRLLNTNLAGPENARHWADFFMRTKSLRVFHCTNGDGSPLGDSGLKILCRGISQNRSLLGLRLGDKSIGKEGIEALGAALMQNLSITHVEIVHRYRELRAALEEAVKGRSAELHVW